MCESFVVILLIKCGINSAKQTDCVFFLKIANYVLRHWYTSYLIFVNCYCGYKLKVII